jgi:choline dehydrogenase-like flavoprotein
MKVDTLIIGSGVAATALAQRLIEHKPQTSILLLEAGKRLKTMDFGMWTDVIATGKLPYDPLYDLNYPERDIPGENLSVGGTEMPLSGGRAFVYGGSTMVWGGWSFRLKPEDFNLQSNTGEGLDWPFDYAALEPWYCQAEEHLAVSGDANDPTVPRGKPYPFPAFPYTRQDQEIGLAMGALGIGYSHMPIARRGISTIPSRHAPCQTTGTCKYCPFGARYVASNYMDEIREWSDCPNLNVKLGAVVMTICMNGKRRATGVTYYDSATGQTVSVDADRVIIAAGTIESAKLLLRSTSPEWPDGLGNDSDNVGRYLVTHPYFVFKGSLPSNPLALQPEMDFPTLVSRHYDNPQEQPKGKFILINPPDTVPVAIAALMQSGKTHEAIDTTVSGPNQLTLHGMMEVFGRWNNRVTNLDRLNHLGMPQTIVDYTQDPTFNERVTRLQQHVKTIFRAMGGNLTTKPNISWRCDHAASTCRMSKDPVDGVVDADLRVHGTDNLYVCSNAVFPNIGAINPTATLTALALRLGDHLNGTA